VDSSKQATTVSDLPAYNVSATIRRQNGESMALRGVVTLRGQARSGAGRRGLEEDAGERWAAILGNLSCDGRRGR